MQKMSKLSMIIWLPRVIFIICAMIFISKYFNYLYAVVPFPYDWEPTDGDHLNFAHRLAQGLPIYLSLNSGQVLSIYNPLFHSIVALIGGVNASLSFAREISLLFWLLTPLITLFYFKNKWGLFYAAIAAVLILLPAEPGMLIDIVHVNPNSLMAFIFLVSLLYATHCFDKKRTNWWNWLLIGALGSLCYLAKQQGLIAIAIITFYMFLRSLSFKIIALTLLGFFLLFLLSAFYFEFINSGEYLNMTLLEVSKLIDSNSHLARSRLFKFLFYAHPYFFVCILYSFYVFIYNRSNLKELSIWQVSFLLHIPFLLVVLGNGGGGPNYFLTLWISMILLCIDTVKKSKIFDRHILGMPKYILVLSLLGFWRATNYLNYPQMAFWLAVAISVIYLINQGSFYVSDIFYRYCNSKAKYNLIFSNIVLITLFMNANYGIKTASNEINNLNLPSPVLEKKMHDYYQSIKDLVANKPAVKILTNRNIGALVSNGVNIENEGSTMFAYAWNNAALFNRNLLLNHIRQQRFDFITTGIQEYPKEVRDEIAIYYRPLFTREVNLNLGILGPVTVFVPNNN